MNENTILTDLPFGAQACPRNAERFLSDAEKLLGENGNISSFLLYIFALEELSKVSILLEGIEKGRNISQKDWDDFKWRDGHVKKLSQFYRARDSSDAQLAGAYGLNLTEILDKMAKSQGSQDRQSHLIRIAKDLHHLRLAQNYVNFHEGKWYEPQTLDKGHVWREIILVKHEVESMKGKIKLLRKGAKP